MSTAEFTPEDLAKLLDQAATTLCGLALAEIHNPRAVKQLEAASLITFVSLLLPQLDGTADLRQVSTEIVPGGDGRPGDHEAGPAEG
ncbi:hypothetical protein [Nocardia xishanensis]